MSVAVFNDFALDYVEVHGAASELLSDAVVELIGKREGWPGF